MNFFRNILPFLLLPLFGIEGVYSQKYICDSLIVKFGIFSNRTIPLKVDSIIDQRFSPTGSQIRISERKRYLYVPVDFYYVTPTPLKDELRSMFSDSISRDSTYKLVINRFEIYYRSGFQTLPVLIAHIEVYFGKTGEKKRFAGTLIYETVGEKPKKNMEKETFEILIEKWKDQFSRDMQKIQSYKATNSFSGFSNLLGPELKPVQRIFTQAAIVVGDKNLMVDGDLGFFEPEATKKFFRVTSFVRYRNDDRFESIAFGSRSYLYYYRINEKFVANIEQKICIGVNRWKDMKTFEHKLYDIVHIDAGFRAGIYYYPFNKRNFVAGLITTHDVLFIYCMESFYRPALGLSVGLNF
jgi:CRISPR/Cas system CSM-associated protein Csm3 (group 7 of RAMP superfamily)